MGEKYPPKNVNQESEMLTSMHGTSALESSPIFSLIKKDGKSLQRTKADYDKYWENGDADEARKSRTTQYMPLVNK